MEKQFYQRPSCEIKWLQLFVLVAIVLTASAAHPQQTLTISNASVANASVVSLSDFNITGSGSSSTLFQVTISTSAPPTVVTMAFVFESEKYHATIIDAKTKPFTLTTAPRTFTNRDFGSNSAFADISIDYLNFNTNLVNELQDAILRSGRLPNDLYRFQLRLEAVNNPSNNDTETLELDITNPTTLTLVSPGSDASRAECYELYTTLPLFQWDSNIDKFEIRVCEQLPTNSSPEDVMQNQPRVLATLVRDVDFFGKPSFLYPASGVLPLLEGHTYYWQVLGIVDSPSGEIRLPSEIWCFKLSALGSVGVDLTNQQLLSLLAGVLGDAEVNALFGTGGALSGFRPSGVMLINGRRVDMTALTEILNQLRNGSRQLRGVTIE